MDTDNPHRHNRRHALLLMLVFFFLASAGLGTAYFLNQTYYQNARAQAEHYQNERAQIVVAQIRSFLFSAMQLAKTLRVLVEQYQGQDPKQIEEYLDRIVESAPSQLVYGAGVWYEPNSFLPENRFFGPYVHRGEGSEKRILTYEWTRPDYDFHGQHWYKNGVKAKGEVAFSEPYYDAGIVYTTLSLSFAERNTEALRGVVTVGMALHQLQSLIEQINGDSPDIIYVVGKKGQILAHPEIEELKDLAGKRSKGQSQNFLDLPWEDGLMSVDDPLVFEEPMKENGWKVVVASPPGSVLHAYHEIKSLIVGTTAIYLLTLTLFFFLIRYFSEEMRRLKERSVEAIMFERNQIKAILDNIQFGLMRVDRNGHVQPGYSLACERLVGIEAGKSLAGRTLWELLDLSQRDADHYRLFFEQVFELPFLADDMVHQIPSDIIVKGRILGLRYYPIKKGEEIESVLISFADISRSRHMETENERNKTLIRILRIKERFMDLVAEIIEAPDGFLECSERQPQGLRAMKRVVHTWKGNLATFGLSEIAAFVHSIEDVLNAPLAPNEAQGLMHVLKGKLVDFLNSHHAILKISPDALHDRNLHLSERSLRDLLQKVRVAKSVNSAVQVLQEFISKGTMEKGEDIISYLSIAAMEVAKRQEKNLRIESKGERLSLPQAYSPIFASLIHIVRNAVDHGIERPSLRGTKSPTGRLEIELIESNEGFQIIIADDGRGIDLQKLKNSALKKGLCSESAWDQMSPEAQLRIIFVNEISTHDAVSEVSGRGVGLDRCLSLIEEQGGTLSVSSRPGLGCRFEIFLPKEPLSEPQPTSFSS